MTKEDKTALGLTAFQWMLAIIFGLLIGGVAVFMTAPHPVVVPTQVITPVPTPPAVVITEHPTPAPTPVSTPAPTTCGGYGDMLFPLMAIGAIVMVGAILLTLKSGGHGLVEAVIAFVIMATMFCMMPAVVCAVIEATPVIP